MMKSIKVLALCAAMICSIASCSSGKKEYRNYFKELGYSQEEIDAKIQSAFHEVFESERRAYHEVGDDMAYVADVKNNDVRTEGQSYGMMVAVQMDKQDMFDRIWTWTKTYMEHKDGPMKGFFAWHCRYDGTHIDEGSASDGEFYFVTDLLLASRRWGNKGKAFSTPCSPRTEATE